MQNRWEKDGKQMNRVEINVNHVQLIGEKPEQQNADLPEHKNFVDDYGDLQIPF